MPSPRKPRTVEALFVDLLKHGQPIPEHVFESSEGWSVEPPAPASGATAVKFTSHAAFGQCLVDERSRRRDPRSQEAPLAGLLAGDQLWYVVWAPTETEQGELIRQALNLRVPNVEACWTLTNGSKAVYLRLAFLDAPWGMLEDYAPLVFWGPFRSSAAKEGPEFYCQWPYQPGLSADLSARVLGALPLPARVGAVFLGRQACRAVTVGARGKVLWRSIFHDARWKASIAATADALPRRTAGAALSVTHVHSPTPPDLEVELRLSSRAPRDSITCERLQLAEEIEVRVQTLEAMNEVTGTKTRAPFIREPLFFFDASEPGLPEPLRRLLVEWSDQKEALGSVYYRHLRTVLPYGEGPARDYHVVTTGAAIGAASGEQGQDVAAWLRRYVPDSRGAVFELMPEWQPRMRLFASAGDWLGFYPEVRPGGVLEDKLGATLLPDVPADERQHHLVVLGGRSDRPVSAVHFPIGRPGEGARAFAPIADTLTWRFAVEAVPAKEASDVLQPWLDHVERVWRAGLEDTMAAWLKIDAAGLQDELTAAEQRLKGLRVRLESVRRLINRLDRLSFEGSLTALRGILDQIRHRSRVIRARTRRIFGGKPPAELAPYDRERIQLLRNEVRDFPKGDR